MFARRAEFVSRPRDHFRFLRGIMSYTHSLGLQVRLLRPWVRRRAGSPEGNVENSKGRGRMVECQRVAGHVWNSSTKNKIGFRKDLDEEPESRKNEQLSNIPISGFASANRMQRCDSLKFRYTKRVDSGLRG